MSNGIPTTPTPEDVRAVSPALVQYTQSRLLGDLWKRPDLSPRDRSIVTLAALIARNQTTQMAYYLNLAFDNGVKPSEISEIITHLAFYSGWENAMSAVVVAKEVFHKRGIGPDQLPPASVELLPLNEAAEKQRSTSVEQNFGTVAPGRLCSTPPMYSSVTFGCARRWCLGTGAWSRSALSLPQAKWRKSFITSTERWITG